MKCIDKLVFSCCILLLAGCSTMSRVDSVSGISHSSLSDASQSVIEVGTISKNSSIRLEIMEDISPKINHEETLDYFEVISVDGVAGEKFSFRSDALCDCLGFRKWSVNPKSYLFDSQGNTIEVSLKDSPTHTEITGIYPETGKYKLVILAESKYVGKRLGSIPGYISGVNAFSLPLTAHPTGKLVVSSN